MKRVLKATVVSLVVIVMAAFNLSAVDTPPEAALKAAEAGLVDFMKMSSDASLKNGVVDFGFRIYTVEPVTLLKKGTQTLQEAVVPTDMWRFVVKSEDKAAMLITVDMVEGKWQAVSFGAKGIAGEMSEINKTWSKGAGYDFRFVRVYQAKSDFIQVSKDADILGYNPLASAKKAFQYSSEKLDATTLLYDHEIVAPLKEVVGKVLVKKDLSNAEVSE